MHAIRFFYIGFFTAFISSHLNAQTIGVKQYIDLYKHAAMREMIDYKIPASITLAQGLLESGSGNSRLATSGNNHFGIKCKKDWTGCTILEDDDDLQECFRCYTSAEESYKDHSRFLSENKRYANLFTLEITNYKGWAAGLLAAGYATNQKYTELLIGCIERNKLAQYDTMVMNGYDPEKGVMPANFEIVNPRNIPTTVIQPNQTLESVAEQNHKTEKKLARYNDLEFHKIEPGDVVYLKPKKRKAGVAFHTVAEGEDMWLISQKYAIRLNSLYKKNLMEKGTEPLAGSVLHLQDKADIMPDTGRRALQNNSTPRKETGDVVNKGNTADVSDHIVKAGETLYSISKLYNISVEELKKINQLTDNGLSVGQKLKITQPAALNQAEKFRSHSVMAGETLYSISRFYKVSIDDIKKWNNLISENLSVGQIIVIH